MKIISLVLFIAIFLSGCASSRLTDDERIILYQKYVIENTLEEVKSIRSFRYSGWRELGKKHLILFSSFSKPYLITLKHTCIDLRFSNTLGLNRSGSSLDARFDSIFVTTFPEQKCFIKTIHKLTREQADQMSDLGDVEKEKSEEDKTQSK